MLRVDYIFWGEEAACDGKERQPTTLRTGSAIPAPELLGRRRHVRDDRGAGLFHPAHGAYRAPVSRSCPVPPPLATPSVFFSSLFRLSSLPSGSSPARK